MIVLDLAGIRLDEGVLDREGPHRVGSDQLDRRIGPVIPLRDRNDHDLPAAPLGCDQLRNRQGDELIAIHVAIGALPVHSSSAACVGPRLLPGG